MFARNPDVESMEPPQTNTKLLIFGASGHAKDVISVALDLGCREVVMATTNGGKGFWGIEEIPVSDDFETRFSGWEAIVGIGANAVRKRYMAQFPNLQWTRLVAPTASVGRSVSIGFGSFIAPQAFLGPECRIGVGALINAGAVVGHESQLGDFCQLGPRATVLGNVDIGAEVLLGAGSVVAPGRPEVPLRIAAGVSVGMGGLVMSSISEKGARLVSKPNLVGVAEGPL